MAMGPWLASCPSLSFLASRAVQSNLGNLVYVLDVVGARTMSTGGCRRRGRSAGSRAKLVVDDEQVDVRTRGAAAPPTVEPKWSSTTSKWMSTAI